MSNFHHISSVCEENFHNPQVVNVPLGYINRENFNNCFRQLPSQEQEYVKATWGCYLGGDLLSLLGAYGLTTRSLMPCPVAPLTWDDMSNIFWFPCEKSEGGAKIKNVMLHLLGDVVGPGGGNKHPRKKVFFKNENTLLDSMCDFYSTDEYKMFQTDILHFREDFIEKLNKQKGTTYTWETLPRKQKKACGDHCVNLGLNHPTKPHGFGREELNFMIERILFDPLHANHNHGRYNMSSILMVTKKFGQFVECVFPEETDDETVTHKWGVCKTSEQFVEIEAARKCFETVMCILSERKEMNIMCSKTLKTFSEHPNDMSASKLAWRYDGCAFKEHFNVIFEIILKHSARFC